MNEDDDDFEVDDLTRPPGAIGKSWRVWRCPVCATPVAIYEDLPEKPVLIDCFGCGHRERDGSPMIEPGVRA